MRIAAVSLNSCIDRTLEVPEFAIGAHVQARLVSEIPAGKGVNIARLLQTLNIDVSLHALVGKDWAHRFAASFHPRLSQFRLFAAFERTRLNTTIIDPINRTETHLRERGSRPESHALTQLEHELHSTYSAEDCVALCGSLPPGVSEEVFGSLITALRQKDIFVAVDTSGPSLRAAIDADCSLIKPNRYELADLLGMSTSTPMQDMINAMTAAHPHLAVLASDGSNGAYFACQTGQWHARLSEPVPIRNTVGAGDALLAGFLAARANREDDADALVRAVRVATSSLPCLRAGELDKSMLTAEVNVLALSDDRK